MASPSRKRARGGVALEEALLILGDGGSGGATSSSPSSSSSQQQQQQQQQGAEEGGEEEETRRQLAECLERLSRSCRGSSSAGPSQHEASTAPAPLAFEAAASSIAAAAAAASAPVAPAPAPSAAAAAAFHGRRPKSSRFRGVAKFKRTGRFMASLYVPGEGEYYLGSFATEEEAARARDAEVRRRGLGAERGFNFPNAGERLATAAAPASRGPQGSSRYRGVGWVKQKKKWKAGLYVSGEKTPRFLGYFASEEAAARAYDDEVRRAGLSPAWLHFPSEQEAALAAAAASGTADDEEEEGAPAEQLAGLASFAAAAAVALQQLEQEQEQE